MVGRWIVHAAFVVGLAFAAVFAIFLLVARALVFDINIRVSVDIVIVLILGT
jgi:hypothetical protein